MVLLFPLHFSAATVHWPHAMVLIIPMLTPKSIVVKVVDLIMKAAVLVVGEAARVLVHGVLHWRGPIITGVPHAGPIAAGAAASAAVHIVCSIVPPVLIAIPVVAVPGILIWRHNGMADVVFKAFDERRKAFYQFEG